MKRMETKQFVIGENTFYIVPFAAFAAASIGGELTALLAPIVASVIPAVSDTQTGENDSADGGKDFLSTDINEILPALASAAAGLSGDKLERIMTRLLIESGNVSVQGEITGGTVTKLTKDLADEIFCTELQDMFALCYEVVKLNYGGMLGKFADKVRDRAAAKEEA